ASRMKCLSVRVMAEAPVEIVDYDASWPEGFLAERRVLEPVLKPWLTGAIEHVGSTAIAGMPAKPVIDIMAGVADLEVSRPAIEAVSKPGYVCFPYRPDIMHSVCQH